MGGKYPSLHLPDLFYYIYVNKLLLCLQRDVGIDIIYIWKDFSVAFYKIELLPEYILILYVLY